MSELKAKRAYFSEDEYERGAHKICAKVSDCGYDRKNDWWSYAFEEEVYIKSEADKVIAELKADYKEACDRLQTANLIKDEQKAKADKLLSCLKYLVMGDLIKDCPPKKVATEIVKEYENGLG